MTTLTFILDGEVPLEAFTRAMNAFHALLNALSTEIGPDEQIDWIIEELTSGSARATVRGEAKDPEILESVAGAYLAVGQALELGKPIPYPPQIKKQAQAIADLISDNVTAIRFESSEDVATISASPDRNGRRQTLVALGRVEGRVQTLTSRDSLRFTLYDSVFDRPVTCYLEDESRDLLRDIWDRRAAVEGWVTRDAETGRPLSIRGVRAVLPIDDVSKGSYLRARGLLTPIEGAPLPEETIRQLRDA